MKNKVINLFDKSLVVENKGVKYSTLLEKFIEPFVNEFADVEYYEDVFEFSINAWNLGNMKLILSDNEINESFEALNLQGENMELLKKMVDFKISHFKEYTNFIADYELKETDADPILTVITQEENVFLGSMLDDFETENTDAEYEENYINRSAIILKPLQSFIDWCANLYPDDLNEIKETKTYLINEDIEDIEAWLKRKYEDLFSFELESWHENKKEWPQKRNYKMFKEWFQVDISRMIYDFEMKPVSKS